MLLKLLVCVTFILCIGYSKAQDVSPCPKFFIYEGRSSEPNKWYGIVTLQSDTDLKGIWLRLQFDHQSLELGNWFGRVNTSDHTEYLIKDRNFELKAHTPHPVRFYIKYDPRAPVPRLVSFRLNARIVCPEPTEVSAPAPPKLQTSEDQGTGLALSIPISSNGHNAVTTETAGTPPNGEVFFDNPLRKLVNQPVTGTSINPNLNLAGLTSNCGSVVIPAQPQFANGHDTHEGEFPWHAAIYHVRGIDLAYVCGATLISKYHLLTAAHCITKKDSNSPLDAEDMLIYLGKYHLRRFSSTKIQDRQIASIIPHPNYNPKSYNDDIALIKLVKPADITDYVRPVCLWQEAVDSNLLLNRYGRIVGWGFDEIGKLTPQLMQTKMHVVPQDTCIYSNQDFAGRFTNANTYCAGYKNGTVVCNGDSGSGMVMQKPDKVSWQLRGIISLSVASQGKCDPNHYVVLTDSAKYLAWIGQAMLL